MFTYNEITDAFWECYKNKKKTGGAEEFLFGYQEKLFRLTDEINNKTYAPLPSNVFIITDPKIREVFAADFRDRIVHHLVIRELLPYFQQYFIPECFSCMPGRGNLYGVQVLADYMNRCSLDWYVLKMDVTSFFMSIRKSLLADQLTRFIIENYQDQRKLDDLVWLCREIALHDPTKCCNRVGNLDLIRLLPPEKSLFCLPPDKGLPIGNYSSQMFANFYMTPLDLFIKYTLQVPFYGRYVDDLVMYGPKDLLLWASGEIRSWAKSNLDIDFSQNKFYIQPISHGVKFLGSVIKPGRIYCGNRLRGELEKKLYRLNPELTDVSHALSVFNSYLGLMNHYASRNIRVNLLSRLPNGWDIVFEPDKEYTKLTTL